MSRVNHWPNRGITGLILLLLLMLIIACRSEMHTSATLAPVQSQVNFAVMNLVDPDSVCLVEPAAAAGKETH